jgi:uncharacterized protein YpmS
MMKRLLIPILLAVMFVSFSSCGGFSFKKPTTVGTTETTATGSILDQMNSKLDALQSTNAGYKIQLAQLQAQNAQIMAQNQQLTTLINQLLGK